MELENAEVNLLVQVSKLQVALRHVTAERDDLKNRLAEQMISQQQCIASLLVAKEQMQHFQASVCSVKDSNEQLLAQNIRLQQQVQQLHRQRPRQPRQNGLGVKEEATDQLPLLSSQIWRGCAFVGESICSSTASSWDGSWDGSSSKSSNSNSTNNCVTGSCSDWSRKLAGAAAAPCLSCSEHTMDQLVGDICQLGCEQCDDSPAAKMQFQQSTSAANACGELSAAAGAHLTAGKPSQVSEDAAGTAAVSLAASKAPGQPSLPEIGGPVQRPVALIQQQHSGVCAGCVARRRSDESATCIILTPQQLDHILHEIKHLQQQLAQTTTKLDAMLPQDQLVASRSQMQQQQQHHHNQQQLPVAAAHVPLQSGDQSIVQWYEQLRGQQQQLQNGRQQLLGMDKFTANPGPQLGGKNRGNRITLACKQQPQERSVGNQATANRPPWNYQNQQLRTQQQAQRLWLQKSVLQLPQRHDMPAAAACSGTIGLQGAYLDDERQQTMQHQEVQEVAALISTATVQLPSNVPLKNVQTLSDTASGHNATTAVGASTEACDEQAMSEQTQKPPRAEGSWVSSEGSEGGGAEAGAVCFMQPTSMRCAAVVNANTLL